MTDLGTYFLGDHVPLELLCQSGFRTIGAPTACPTYSLYKNDGTTALVTGSLSIIDKPRNTRKFGHRLFLNEQFSVGVWWVHYQWTISATEYHNQAVFSIVSGGDSRGTPISMHFYEQRSRSSIVWQTDGGHIVSGNGPRVET